MANKRITELTDIGTPDPLDVLEIVDTSDTTDSPEGTSKKVKVSELGGGGGGAVDSVNGQTGVVSIGLQEVLDVNKIATFTDTNGYVVYVSLGDEIELDGNAVIYHSVTNEDFTIFSDKFQGISVQFERIYDNVTDGLSRSSQIVKSPISLDLSISKADLLSSDSTDIKFSLPEPIIESGEIKNIEYIPNPKTVSGTYYLATLDDISGGGSTNLGYTPSPTNGTVTSDTGTDATIPLADGTNAGLLSPTFWTLLTNFATNVRSTVLTGLSTATTTAVLATDTILQAIGKLQGQMNLKANKRTLMALDSNRSLTATTALQAIFNDPIDVVSGEYIFSIETTMSSLATSGNIQFGVLGTAGVTSVNWISNGNKQAAFPTTNQIQSGNVTTAVPITGASTGTNAVVKIDGRIVFSSAGTFIPAFLFSTSPTTGIVGAGSSVSTIKVD